jgi:hypothetical protein
MSEVNRNASPLAEFDDLLTERQVLERYPQVLSERELRKARSENQILFLVGKKGQIHYHPVWLADYLKRKITPCHRPQSGSGNTEIIGSAVSLVRTISMPAGGTSEQNERVAEVLTQKFLPKRKSA